MTKKLFAILAVLIFTAGAASAGDITLTTPIAGPSTTKVSVDAYKMDSTSVIAEISFRAADNTVLGSAKVILVDECIGGPSTSKAACEAVPPATPDDPNPVGGTWNNWFSAVENDKIIAGDVDKKTSALLEKKIRNQVKQRLGLVGTVVP